MACAEWIADFNNQNFHQRIACAGLLLSQPDIDRAKVRELIYTACKRKISLLTADETLNLSKFISREQLSPTSAYQLIHDRVIAPMHYSLTSLVGRYTGRDPDDTETILHTHALLGQRLAFRLGARKDLLRTGWTDFDQACVQQIGSVVLSHVDFILEGLSVQRGKACDEK